VRYRKLDPDGDYLTGHGTADFYYNQPEAVGQAVLTRMLLFEGEWFLDLGEGTPWGGFPLNQEVVRRGQILGANTRLTRDVALQTRALGTRGLSSIANYGSQVDPNTRRFGVQMSINTIYGQAQLGAKFPTTAPASPGTAFSEWDSAASFWDSNASHWDRSARG
jgi:hypothetical protein